MARPTIFTPNGENAGLSPAQRECVQLLERALESAKNGEVSAVVLVAVGPADFGIAMAGSDAPKMHMGCAAAMRTILDRTTPPEGNRTLRIR